MLAGLAFLAGSAAFAGTAVADREGEAALVENLAKFVTWPAVSLPYPHSPLVVGIVGDDLFGPGLERCIVRGRRVHVVHLPWDGAALRGCHILVIGASEAIHLPQILQAVAGAPVLTVAGFEPFAKEGGHVEWQRDGVRLRFEINEAAAEASGLRISSKLLTLAARDRGREKRD